MNRNINWHSRNDIRHDTGPDSRFLTSQIWMNGLEDDIQANGMEIIELNTTDNSQTSNEDTPENPHFTSHPWSYTSRLSDFEDTFKANRQARLRRRLRNRNHFPENGTLENEFDSSIYFDNTWTPDTADVETFNQTCFTILDKLSALELDNSHEDFEESGNEERPEVMLEAGWNGKGESGEELVSYGSGLDGEKHTIWIYSFKNRRMLSDIDFESVNIPSHESTTSSSFSEIDEELNTSKSARVPSPIPAAHIPRLNLSLGATLPNVTEVTEPKSSESLIRKKHVIITQKPANNWCLDISEKSTITENKVTNIVNWMALSPRERRRHSWRNSEAPIQLQSVPEVSQDDEMEQFETETTKAADFKAEKPNLEKIEIETADEAKFSKPPNSQINSQRSSANSRRENFRNDATYLISPFPPRRVNLDLSYKTEHESELTNLKHAVRGAFSDRGSYKVQRPRITVGNPFLLSPITKPISIPIENLNSNDWIAEYEPKSCRQDRRRVMSAGDRLMARNLALLKPSEWKSYSPVTGSRLYIDLGSELEPKKTLLQRCFSCFKCCK